jgi:hypothetical protein
MSKKQVKIKKSGGGDISITIENNLKPTQTNLQPKSEKRKKRRPRTDLTNSKIDDILKGGGTVQQPLKDVSYIKPPSNNFTIWRDTLDSFNTTIPINQAQQMGLVAAPVPPAPAPPALPPTNNTFNIGNSQPERSVNDGPSWRDFSMFMAGMSPDRGRPTNRNWSNMFDDEDDRPTTLQFGMPNPSAPPEQEENIEQEIIIPQAVIDQLPVSEEQKAAIMQDQEQKKRIKQAKRQGTMHANKGIEQQGPYMDMDEYKEAYQTAVEKKAIDQERMKKVLRQKINKMYEKGKKDVEDGVYPPRFAYKDNEDYMRGFNEAADKLPSLNDQEMYELGKKDYKDDNDQRYRDNEAYMRGYNELLFQDMQSLGTGFPV